jgi:hypothetical protein
MQHFMVKTSAGHIASVFKIIKAFSCSFVTVKVRINVRIKSSAIDICKDNRGQKKNEHDVNTCKSCGRLKACVDFSWKNVDAEPETKPVKDQITSWLVRHGKKMPDKKDDKKGKKRPDDEPIKSPEPSPPGISHVVRFYFDFIAKGMSSYEIFFQSFFRFIVGAVAQFRGI